MSGINSTMLMDSAIPQDDVDEKRINPRLVSGIVVFVLLVLNLTGNLVVFLVYHFRVQASVFSFYVKVLAGLDVTTALTTMLIDVIIKVRPVDEKVLDLTSLCKITHFQVYAQSLVSGCVLTLIAYQRYRKICRPLEPGLTIRTAKRSLMIISVVCIPLCIPTLIVNGPQDIQIQVKEHVINLTICRNDNHYDGTRFQTAFSIFLLSAFCLILCLTIIFYMMVAKALRKFERRNSMVSKRAYPSNNIAMINEEHGFNANDSDGKRREFANRSQPPRGSVSSGENNERISIQMYRVFATITVIFIISYLPHLVVLIVTKSMRLDDQAFTLTGRTLLDLAYNCPYISTVANPIVYGYCNTTFRDRLKNICRSCRRG